VTSLGDAELAATVTRLGHPPYRARQIQSWVWQKRATGFDDMTDLPVELRQTLKEALRPLGSHVMAQKQSPDGTTKLLLELEDGERVETVLIPEGERRTACLSTQVGCPVACIFCASGLDGVLRNLTAAEIAEQALHLERLLPGNERLTNIVVMGSGEPLLNEKNLGQALHWLNDAKRFGLGARRITVSTVGLPEKMRRLSELGLQIELAVSLHAPTDEIRKRIVPGARPVGEVLDAAFAYRDATGREVTFEYVLLESINDGLDHAEELARRLGGRPCLVNLIPHNPVPGVDLRAPAGPHCERFLDVLLSRGVRATLRRTKGQPIEAACGQLRRIMRPPVPVQDPP
jgi:23S rRNA (adenine2503-C2)-methyltransferase